jgi:hypothetical protein
MRDEGIKKVENGKWEYGMDKKRSYDGEDGV